MKHVMCVIAREGAFWLEFSVDSRCRILSVSFWEGKQLVCMPIALCGRDMPLSRKFVAVTSQLLNVIGGEATINCCGGSNVDFIKTLDKSPGREVGMHYLFCLTPVQFEQLLHKRSFSVMGNVDILSMLRNLLLRMRGLLDERWVQSTQFFRRVEMSCETPLFLLIYTLISVLRVKSFRRWTTGVAHSFSVCTRDNNSLATNQFIHWCHWTTPGIPAC